MKQGPQRALISYFFIFVLTAITVGCSSGGSGGDSGTSTGVTPSSTLLLNVQPGPIITLGVGETAILDGSYSSASTNEALAYEWSFTSIPHGSNAQLQNSTTVNPSFIADVKGTYRIQLVVSASGVTSQRTVAIVQAGEPTGPVIHQNFSSNCTNCHSGDYVVVGTKIATHLATSNLCQSCHSTFDFASPSFIDHQEVFGNCDECHDGIKVVGKSIFHQPTDAACDDCHNTTSFLELNADGSFDHTNLSRLCSGCHNGTVATGMTPTIADTPPGTHPDTDHECGYCHTTVTFKDAYPDHTGPSVVGPGITCDSCHAADGTGSASGQTVGHPDTTSTNVDCDVCHSIVTFKLPGGIFNHSLVDPTVQPCESCHNDSTSINAPTKSSAVNHPTTSADCGSCHNTESFIPAFIIDHSDPDVLAQRCDNCHVANGTGSASGKPLTILGIYEHMPTDEDCGECHTPGTFSTGTFGHTGPSFVGSCDSCHNNVISVGKLENHIPTNPDNQDCADCHTTTTFAGAAFNHVGINTSNCASCHDGNISKGKSLNHLPTNLDCSSCHATNNFVTFAGITFNHLGIDPNDCASCHNTGIATPKAVNHIPAQTECSQCHNDTSIGGFASSIFMSNVHPGLTQGCEGCHSSPFLPTANGNPNVVKAASHLPTNQDCGDCHTNTSFTPSIFAHTGITANCASCHDGSVNNVAVGARGATNTPTHQNTNEDCGVCHNTVNFADAFVDHTSPEVLSQRCDNCHNGVNATGKNNGHVVTNEDCGLCHVPGTFATAVFDHTGIVNNCESCHNGIAATGKDAKTNPTHAPTNEDCSVCHNTTAFAGARFDHQGIVNSCATCHDGIIATGKAPTPNHVPTNKDCSNCHQTTGFLPATFDHAGIVNNCSSCHGAGFATGKTDTHVVTNQDCGICHNTSSFIPATFDHTGITNNCESCHGVTATGKDNDHVATDLDCHFCHTTATFVGGTWTHDANSAGNCDSCHSNTGGATSKPSGHLSTNVQCDECHSTERWAPDIFSHDSNGDYPGDHRNDPGCSACHGNSINSNFAWPYSQYAPYCAACHANDFRSESRHIGGSSGTVEQNKNCGNSGCHRITSSGW